MDGETIALIVTVLLAMAGYAIKYLNDVRLAQRKDRLDRINRQLSELYGPLFALNLAVGQLWQVFRFRHRPSGPFWGKSDPPTSEDAAAWRLWMTTVFMPLNREMERVVVQHADLLFRSEEMPKCLLDLCAHVAGYEPLSERWRVGDFDPLDPDHNVSAIDYPADALAQYAETAFRELRAEQSKLLRASGHDLIDSRPA